MKHLLISLLLLSASPALAVVQVVTTSTDIAWAAAAIGKDKVKVKPLLKGTENMHYVEAVPAFIKDVADADVVCSIGLGLEIGWLPKVLSKSGNAKVQKGGKGFCELGQRVRPLDKATGKVDRSMGDMHPEGNPHFWLAPKVFGEASLAISDALSAVDPANATFYRDNLAVLQKKLGALEERLKAKLQPALKGVKLMQYHTDFNYYLAAYGLESVGSVEEKPGVPPSAGRLARVAVDAKRQSVKAVLAVDYDPKGPMDKFHELSAVPVVRVANSIRPGSKLDQYEKIQEAIADQLMAAVKGGSKS